MKKVIRLTESDLTRIVKRVIIEQNDYNTPKKWKDWEKEGYEREVASLPIDKNEMFYGQLSERARTKQNAKDVLLPEIIFSSKKYGFDVNKVIGNGRYVYKNLDNGIIECRLLTKEKLF